MFDVADGEAALRPLAESAVREVVGRRALLDLLTASAATPNGRRRALLQERLAAIGSASRCAGRVSGHPSAAGRRRRLPRRLARRRATASAGSTRRRLPRPDRGRGQRQGRAIRARRGRRPAAWRLAAGAADTFNCLACRCAGPIPRLTDFRLFWTTVAEASPARTKLLLDEEPGRRRHLIVPSSPGRVLPALIADGPEKKAAARSATAEWRRTVDTVNANVRS